MHMGVDKSGHHESISCIDDATRFKLGVDLRGWSCRDDPAAIDRDRSVAHKAGPVAGHCEQMATRDERVDHCFLPLARSYTRTMLDKERPTSAWRWWGDSLVGLVSAAYLNASISLGTAGPRMITYSDGKIRNAMGKSILSGAFCANSSAFCRRRVRIASDWMR